VLRNGRDLTIEIDAETALDWEPAQVSAVWAGGRRVRAEIVADRTTSPGAIVPGLTVRLGVRLVADAPADLPEQVLLLSKGQLVTVTIGRG